MVFLHPEAVKVQDVDLDLSQVAILAADAASSKKARATRVLDVSKLHSLVDLFVITSASNPRQIRSIVDAVEETIRLAGGGSPMSKEGLEGAEWILLDYAGVVVHVFSEEARKFYDLERLWSDGEVVYSPVSDEDGESDFKDPELLFDEVVS